MSIIVPYEDKLYTNDGAFIDPNGKILFTYGQHLEFAINYCFGEEYSYLTRLKYGNTYNHNAFEDYKKFTGYQGKQEDIDVFSSSQLTKDQMKLLNLYCDDYSFSHQYSVADFLVLLLHFDKVETVMRERITTADSQPHVRFYNYYLMGWKIDKLTPMKYNSETKIFEWDENDDLISSPQDRDAEEEIKEIKSRVLVKDRYLYFK